MGHRFHRDRAGVREMRVINSGERRKSRDKEKGPGSKVKFNTGVICWGKSSTGVGRKEASRQL